MALPYLSVQQLQDQLAHIHDDRSTGMLVAAIVFIVVSIIVVVLRLASRRIQGLRFGPDDYFIIVSLALAIGMFVALIDAIKLGMGKHVILAGYIDGPEAARALYIVEILFPASNTAAKLSTLLLYKRIFGATRNRYFAIAVWILCTLWAVLCVIGTCCTVFQCGYHIDWAWTTDHSVGCIDLSAMVLGLTIVSVWLNFFTLILPVPFVVRLQLEPKTKFAILFVFVLGCGDMIISVVRAIETAGTNLTDLDFTWLQSQMIMLGFSEPCLGIICTSLVLLRPILLKFNGIVHRGFSGLSPSNWTSRNTGSYGSEHDTRPEATQQTTKSQKSGYFVVPIFLQTRSKWESMKSSMKSGLSGATIALTRRDNLDDLEDWERKFGKGKNMKGKVQEMNVITHPWDMDTFEKIKAQEAAAKETERALQSDTSSMTFDTVETVKRLQILKLDKPLPVLPDTGDSIREEGEVSPRSFG